MTTYARLCTGALALLAAASLLAFPVSLEAQEDEGPGDRVTTITTFDVPIQHRSTVMPFIVQRVAPASQLNPKVLNYRIMLHNWGGNASNVVIMAEYADIADIEADCGQPCDDYYDAHPAPEEGEEGYEEFRKGQELFQKYYSKHRDEIFVAPMMVAKVEGELMGPVGGPQQAEEGDGEGM